MTVSLGIPEPKLSELVDRAAAGEEIIIEKAGSPVARLVSLSEPPRAPRVLGVLKGKIRIADDFDAPLPDEILRDFGMID
jgi:antitoxin (DNA-binding transcriptional repressor) of toxin-antitoxin stability system